ncbi:MAG: hypothetical protein ABS35_02330 [Kaistia sp. SCN 65-12]|nr:MAG: hypothetical protein ABS35_02330 [Kaistia sp. SCN 65-12]
MGRGAVARETVFALRRQIAKIEGTLPERLEAPAGTADGVVRCGAAVSGAYALATGADRFDTALGGGLPKAALIEIHGAETRDAGAVGGFALGLASRLLAAGAGPVPVPLLWIGTAEIFGETGFPYAAGLREKFGIEPDALLYCEARKLTDALWIAEEAARLAAPAALVLEIHGNPRRLDLTATRRLHARARACGRPLFLLRQGAVAEPTAAPVRLVVRPSPSVLRETIGGPLAGSIGRPAFTVAVDKGGFGRLRHVTLEWNPDERGFEERRRQEQAKNPLPVVSLPRHGTDRAAAPGAVLAFRQDAGARALGDQPPRREQPPRRRPRRAG